MPENKLAATLKSHKNNLSIKSAMSKNKGREMFTLEESL
jgi:hypothetical protein